MGLEGIVCGGLLAVAVLSATAGRSGRATRWLVALVAFGVALPLSAVWSTGKARALRVRLGAEERPIEVKTGGYASSATCQACHPGQYASWHASYHRTMTQLAAPETVRAPFAGERLVDEDGPCRLTRRGDELWAELPDPAWRGEPALRPQVERRIVMVTGSHHYQVYWFPSGKPRSVWALPFVWLIDEERWIPRGAAFLGPEERTRHILGVWNNSCIKCHATRGRPGADGAGAMDTRVVELGIACEACHGPAEEHARLHRDPRERYRRHLGGTDDASVVDPRELSHRRASEICGQCHGVWSHEGQAAWADWLRDGLDFRPGQALGASVRLLRYDEGLLPDERRAYASPDPSYRMERQFWRDGMVRVSGREYSGLAGSACFERGELSCLSCHRMHRDDGDPRPLAAWTDDQLAPGLEGDRACLACHASHGERVERHTHHPPESSGSRCLNCHMPHTTYGLLKAIRSHRIDSPRVDVELATGRPNACNACHLDRTLAWTAGRLAEWYGTPVPELPPQHHAVAASVLAVLSGDAGQRALAAWSFGWQPAREASGTGWMAPHLAPLLDDPYQAVRYIAARSLHSLPGFERFDYDFLAPQVERRLAVRAALERWRTLPPLVLHEPEPVLLDRAGALCEDRFYPLLASRDERPVELHE